MIRLNPWIYCPIGRHGLTLQSFVEINGVEYTKRDYPHWNGRFQITHQLRVISDLGGLFFYQAHPLELAEAFNCVNLYTLNNTLAFNDGIATAKWDGKWQLIS